MVKIIITKKINAPRGLIWEVITNVKDYPKWNHFIRECDTTFQVGTSIKMRVQLLPFLVITQKETIWQYKQNHLIDYGIKYPLGLLSSSRKHLLKSMDSHTTIYESIFILKGILAPIVNLFLGRQLKRGFYNMTKGIISQVNKRVEGN